MKNQNNSLALLLAAGAAGAFMFYPAATMQGARQALALWARSVFPALFPFCGLVLLFKNLNGMQKAARLFQKLPLGDLLIPVFSAWSAGYPMGAILAGEEKDPARRRSMLALLLCSGPVFMLGTVGAGLLASPKAGAVLLLTHYVGAVLNFSLIKGKKLAVSPAPLLPAVPLGQALSESIEKAMMTLLKVLGFMVLMQAFLSVLQASGALDLLVSPAGILLADHSGASDVVKALLAGFLEMSLGVSALADIPLPGSIQLPLMAFVVGFGGLSVLLQALSFLPEGPGALSLLWLKLRHGLLCALLTWGIVRFLPEDTFLTVSVPVLSEGVLYRLMQGSMALSALLAVGLLILTLALTVGGLARKKRL